MPLAAKILAFLNLLAAALFVYLAGIDYAQRQDWARDEFLHRLVLHGLPVDERDTGWRADRPLSMDIGEGDDSAIAADLFGLVRAKPAVTTQDREVERARAETMKEITGLDDETAKRNRIKELLLAQARSFDEREELIKKKFDNKDVSTDDLKKLLEDRFEDVLRDVSYGTDRQASDRHLQEKRRMIAHLLYNLSPDTSSHQRVMIVVGLNHYVEEADVQAQELRKMIARLNAAAQDERHAFESDYLRLRDYDLILSQDVERYQVALKNLQDLHARQQKELIAPLLARKAQLTKDLEEQQNQTRKLLIDQDDLETKLFGIHSKIGDFLTKNQKLERELRLMELGPVRGAQR
jgi:hypothetical protein